MTAGGPPPALPASRRPGLTCANCAPNARYWAVDSVSQCPWVAAMIEAW
jgi:hypothetical protein